MAPVQNNQQQQRPVAVTSSVTTVSTVPGKNFTAELEVTLDVIDRKLRSAIDLNQVAILSTELVKEIFEKKARIPEYQQIAEMLEYTNSKCIQNCELIKEARRQFDEILKSIKKAEQ